MPRLFDDQIFDPLIFDTARRTVTFGAVPLTFADVLRGSYMQPVARLDFLDPANPESVLRSLDAQLLSGSVTTTISSDTFASASVELVNDDGTLAPESPASLVWADRPVRISRGAIVNGAEVLVALITGVIVDPKAGMATGSVSFSVASRFAIAKRNFSEPLTTPAGRFRDAIRLLLELGGLGTSDALYSLDDGGLNVESRTFGVNEEILGATIKWAFDMACELWPDGHGVARLRPAVDAATLPRTWDFAGGMADTLLSLDRQVSSNRRYNRQVVYGRGLDGYSISGEAKITNPGDPLYWRADFDLPAPPYTSTDLSTTTACLALAERLLRDISGYEEVIPFESVPVPLIAARDVVGFAAVAGSLLLDSVVQPITKGTMRGQARRLRSVTA